MGNENTSLAIIQEFVDCNIRFLCELHPEDVEYMTFARELVANDNKASAAIYKAIKNTNISDLYFAKFPRDESAVKYGSRFFRWKILYCDEFGVPFDEEMTLREMLLHPKIYRQVVVSAPEDEGLLNNCA